MILLLISPAARVYDIKVVQPCFDIANRLNHTEVETSESSKPKLPKEIIEVQEQISELLTSSNSIGKNVTRILQEPLGKNVCISQKLIFTPSQRSNNGWLTINVKGESINNNQNTYRGFSSEDLSLARSSKKSVEIKFESSNWLNELTINELKKYSFGLYLYSKSGNDRMEERKHFKPGYYSYSVDLTPKNTNLVPSEAFKETVRKNYIDEEHTPDQTYFLMAFREDEISDRHEDLLLIY